MDPNEKLCNKDPRNPMFHDLYGYDDEKPVPREGCFCDNCFCGRDALALEIIALREALAGERERVNRGRLRSGAEWQD